MPNRWLTVGSLGMRKTRANLYFSGHVRYVSMSEALSSRPSPRVGRNGSSDGSSRAAIAAARARASRSASRSRSSSELVWRMSRCSGVAARRIAALMPGSASATEWPSRAVHQRGELEQLEVAHGAVGDVEVGVEAQLAEAVAGARDALQQLVAQRLVGGVERLVGAEQLLAAVLPLGAELRPRLLGERRRRLQRVGVAAGRVGEDEAGAARGSSRRAAAAASRRRARRGCRAAAPRAAARRGSARSRGAARPASARTAGRARRRGRTTGPPPPASP